ncbi:class I SAM-dependent methyltransferase [Thermoflexus sp.]|uniref:class I SAM-dependent methyltransferase n=1 Tax=Thermoflexus sp. TaxID=1969742 RepID=UPI0025F46EC1|nr:class I SAM-dependent methyltransferase [Thermoflexus sp.]MDW8180137.1 methyltransferase domain-containing protein [Anaerolineae bacterium]MCS6962836.1 methyltransferase domain-containing protein [Thermoflexus sp.]MCS7350686.1 methyltransferase domain-containing protein [Thermoflexus sp.]MCX7690212.1 methyltransferase domain-containing protein [Thermoflexus sp.]MDW8185021.1 methyltransferase domain-containing protein [Anaerolineae bacterium]
MLDLPRQELHRARYRARRPGWRPAGEVFNALLEPLLSPTARALDAGCGRFGVLGRFRDRVALAVGVDVDFLSLKENFILPLRAQAQLEALPFPAGAFDLILSTWVIEHLPEPERVFQEIARVLRPGGHFLLLTPNARHPLIALGRCIPQRLRPSLVQRLYGRAPQDTFPVFYRANTSRELRRLLDRAGLHKVAWFEIEDPTYLAFHPLLFTLAALYERLTAWPPLRGWRIHLVGLFRKA